MIVPFVGPSNAARSLNQDAQRTLNLYLENDSLGGKVPIALFGVPGLRRLLTLPTVPCRGSLDYGAFLYVVAGNTFYRLDSNYVVTTVGTINTGMGPISMACNGLQIMIVDGLNGYIYDLTTLTLVQITDPNFIINPAQVVYQDTYFIAFTLNSMEWQISAQLDGLVWDALDVAFAEGQPDNIVALISDHRELWFIGSSTIEIWSNTGADFPFERNGSVFIQTGCSAGGSAVQLDNSIFWLGRNTYGDNIVWRSNGYTPVRISTHAVEFAISQYDVIDDAIAFSYQQEGHAFYMLTFPAANKTWCFDCATNMWHERAYFTGASLIRHRAQTHSFFNGRHIVGDFDNGNLYVLDLNTYDDDGQPIIAIRSTQTEWDSLKQQFFGEFTLDFEAGVGLVIGQGSDPKWALRWSDDGHSYSGYRFGSMGKIGEYKRRFKTNRLGRARARIWEISSSEPVKKVILGAAVTIIGGES